MATTTVASPKSQKNPDVNLALTAGITFVWCLIIFLCIKPVHGNQLSAFGTFWASGNAANHGLNPYAEYPATWHTWYGGKDLNYNPPLTLPILQLFATLSLPSFVRVWTITSGLLLTLSGCLLFRKTMQPRQVVWLFASAMVKTTFLSEQIYFVLLLLSAVAIYLFARNDLITAICIGLIVAVRPNMGFWIILLFVAGHQRIAFRSLVTIAVAYLAPVAVYGTRIYRQWLGAFSEDKHWMDVENIGLIPMLKRHGHQSVGISVAVMLAAFVLCWAYKNKPDFASASTIGICTAILCSPIGWFNYMLFVSPFFTARRWGKAQTFAAGLLMVPFALVHEFAFTLYFVAAVIILAAALCQRCRDKPNIRIAT